MSAQHNVRRVILALAVCALSAKHLTIAVSFSDYPVVANEAGGGLISAKSVISEKYLQFFTAGLTQIVWESIDSEAVQTNISSGCRQSLDQTLDALAAGEIWPYRLLDASSKAPSGVLDGTVTSFGDYDQCLNFGSDQFDEDAPFEGSHCMVKFEPDSPSNMPIDKVMRDRVPVFEYYYINLGLCMPSTCSPEDVSALVAKSIESYPLKAYGNFTCDVKRGTSLDYKLRNLGPGQVVAGLFLATIVILAVYGTIVDLLAFDTEHSPGSQFALNFSMNSNTAKLMDIKTGSLTTRGTTADNRFGVMDIVRLSVILAALAGHCLSCLESIPGWYLISRLHEVRGKFSLIWVQPLINEGGLGLVTFVGGFVTFWGTHPLMVAGKFRFFSAVYDRWVKFMPTLMAMVAVDLFLWPLIGDGPLYTLVATHLIKKCTNNAWMNFFFVNNFKTAPENCIPWTFYSGIDLQLFLVAALVIYLICKSPRLGITLASVLIVTGNVLLVFFTHKNKASPVLIVYDPSVPKTKNYLDYVHFATYGHLSNYFVGLLVAYSVKCTDFANRHRSVIHKVYILTISVSIGVHFAPALHNTFHVLPEQLIPFYIMTIKLAYCLYFTLFLYENYPVAKDKEDEKKADEKVVKTMAKKPRTVFAVIIRMHNSLWLHFNEGVFRSFTFQLITRLSLSIYVVNYFYIRYDFFSSRTLIAVAPSTLHVLFKRFFYSVGITLFLAYFFHILCVTPFDNIRKWLKIAEAKRKMKETKANSEHSPSIISGA